MENEVQQPLQKTITGVVVDKITKLPIIGASIAIEGSAIGTITDINGSFTLEVPYNSHSLISFIGYYTVNIPVGNETVFNI